MSEEIIQLEDNKTYTKAEIQTYINKRLESLNGLLAAVASSDYSQDVPMAEQEDEFSELFVSIQLMLDVIREQVGELTVFNKELEAKVAEKMFELTKSNEMNEAILANIGDGLIVVDAHLKILSANRSAEKMLNVSEGDLDHITWPGKYVVVNETNTVVAIDELAVSEALRTGTIIHDDKHMFTRADGSRFFVFFTASTIKQEDTVIGAIIVFSDITLEKEIDQAKTEFVSLAAHQLRAPLSTISWYVETLLDGDIGEFDNEVKESLEQVYSDSNRLIELVNALLDVSRLDLGTFSIQPEPVILVDIITDVLRLVKPRQEEKNLAIKTDIEGAIPVINMDKTLTRMIIDNLITNAIKYTPKGGTVSVSLGIHKAGQTVEGVYLNEDSILFSVRDTGYGIPSYQQGKIFQKLFRADNVKYKDEQGTGLGLYMVKAIISEIEGNIWFESKEGEGTVFYVLLPMSGMKVREGSKKLGE
ncbi:PAS domain-containing protein [candidate division WWE3 bacterium]|uniref:histidine kinase n=1 Tax=candidate division WWE3 bacterium TaxID=2053526 RepID=A0A955LVM2_UNCKA|nr:PAS domain-containing protein [candidate division WWE3 bacterium]